jgi:hypothetical protein
LEEFFKDIEDTGDTEEKDDLDEIFNKIEEKDIK